MILGKFHRDQFAGGNLKAQPPPKKKGNFSERRCFFQELLGDDAGELARNTACYFLGGFSP